MSAESLFSGMLANMNPVQQKLLGLGATADAFNSLKSKPDQGSSMRNLAGLVNMAGNKMDLNDLNLSGLGLIGKFTGAGNTPGAGVLLPSEEETKEGVKDITGALDKVGKLNGVDYRYKGTKDEIGGLLAQDVQKVMPEAAPKMGEMRGVDYAQVTGLLVEAVKELNDKISKMGG